MLHTSMSLRAPIVAALLLLPACSCPEFRAERAQEMLVTSNAAQRVQVRTHNGSVLLTAGDPGVVRGTAFVETRGGDQARADAMLDEVKVFGRVEDGAVLVGWEHDGWWGSCESASVRFELQVPPSWSVELESHNGGLQTEAVAQGGGRYLTHNGDVVANGAAGGLVLESHNGGIRCEAVEGAVRAITHNGGIQVGGNLAEIDAETHNGGVRVAFDGRGAAHGRIETHNGDIEVQLGLREGRVTMTGRSEHDFDLHGRGRVLRTGDDTTELEFGDPATAELRLRTHNGDLKLSAAPAVSTGDSGWR